MIPPAAIRLSVVSYLAFAIGTLSAQQRGGASWVEEFDNNRHNWTMIQSKRLSSSLEEGQLWLRGSKGFEGNLFAIQRPLPSRQDFQLEVSVTHHGGQQNMAYGLVWGAKQDEQDLFAFLISANGKYTILRKERGSYTAIKHWTESEWVRKSGVPNELRIQREGDLIRYYLNEVLVFTGPYLQGRGNRVGILFHGKMKLSVETLELKMSE